METTTKNKILIVEDERKISRFIELELKHEGYDTMVATDGREGLSKAIEEKPDLIILDLMLPAMSGIEVCRRLRQAKNMVPIIMLTAKDDVSDKVMGLDMGADDYMTKPFAIEELLARIRVALKRDAIDSHSLAKTLIFGQLKVDDLKRQVYYGKELLSLTKKEYDLLRYLLANKNIALEREQILEKVWGYDYYGDTNVIDVYVRYLRSKIDQKYGIEMIKTVRGVGYIIYE